MHHERLKYKLTEKDKLFCHLVVAGKTPPDAAREAYKIQKRCTLYQTQYRKMRKAEMIEYMRELEAKIHDGGADEVAEEIKGILKELAIGCFYDPTDFYTFDKDGRVMAVDLKTLPVEVRKAVDGIEFDESYVAGILCGRKLKLRFRNKEKNLELLGKHHKLYTDLIQGTVVTKPEVYVPDNGRDKPANG